MTAYGHGLRFRTGLLQVVLLFVRPAESSPHNTITKQAAQGITSHAIEPRIAHSRRAAPSAIIVQKRTGSIHSTDSHLPHAQIFPSPMNRRCQMLLPDETGKKYISGLSNSPSAFVFGKYLPSPDAVIPKSSSLIMHSIESPIISRPSGLSWEYDGISSKMSTNNCLPTGTISCR